MKKVKVLLISTKNEIKDKISFIEEKLKTNKISFESSVYTNVEVDYDKNVNYYNYSKQDLQNKSISDCDKDCLLIDLDYSKKIIQETVDAFCDNQEEDVINFQNRKNKFVSFFNKIKYFLYNIMLTFLNLPTILDINFDFQFLSEKVVKAINVLDKTPNEVRLFESFDGYDKKTILLTKERVKKEKNLLFLFLALITLVLVIICIITTTVLAIKLTHISTKRIVLVGSIITLFLALVLLGLFSYHNYNNRK